MGHNVHIPLTEVEWNYHLNVRCIDMFSECSMLLLGIPDFRQFHDVFEFGIVSYNYCVSNHAFTLCVEPGITYITTNFVVFPC